MASPPSPAVEDQTDEDFFDKLVEDDFDVTRSGEGSIKIDRSFLETGIPYAGIQLEDSDDTRIASVEKNELENITSQAPQNPEEGAEPKASTNSSNLFSFSCEAETMVSEEKSADSDSSCLSFESGLEGPSNAKLTIRSSDSSVEQSGGSKRTGVKEVQWSAFCTDSHQFSFIGDEPFSDFLIESSDVSTSQVNLNGNLKSSSMGSTVPGHGMDPAYSEKQAIHFHGAENGYYVDANVSNYWENPYPGWKFDASTGQWCQVLGNELTTPQSDNYHSSTVKFEENFTDDHLRDSGEFINSKAVEVSHSEQSSSLMGTGITEDCNVTTVSNWNHYSQGSNGYPSNMVFDPQYPGWFFDTNTQQWSTLDAYNQSIQQTSHSIQNQVFGNVNTCNGFIGDGSSSFNGGTGQLEQNCMQCEEGSQTMVRSYDDLTNKIDLHCFQQVDANHNSSMSFSGNQQTLTYYNSQETGQSGVCSNGKGFSGFQSFVTSESTYQFNQPKEEQSLQPHLSQSFYADEKLVNFNGISYSHTSNAGNEGWSSAGRPRHALVSFGFGGKLVVMKDNSFGYNNEGSSEATVSILNLMEVVKHQADTAGDYFHSLSRTSFPGPLVGGNATSKDVYKWIDEIIMHSEFPMVDPRKGKTSKLLLSLLKISCQHYGKLRSPFGSGTSSEENDGPESAVTKLFASAGADVPRTTHCMQSIPSEAHVRATSIEMQNLLVAGKRKEALQCAQGGQLWGPALVLAAQLGEKFYVDTVKQMAQRLLVCGSPLRTLCLLIAGQPADVFSTECFTNGSFFSTANGVEQPSKTQTNSMLDGWEENLAIITANRTKDDELVVIHLGDSLWKERGEVTAAHTCYLVAEANFEPYSDSARLCLIGADHWKYPRTFASPDAIQRTELYEYAKVLGNSQFVLVPFQPYKFLYANMLAEIGRTSDSLRYCQASMKLLRNSNRTPEVELCKSLLSSLEERLTTHQQGGYGGSLAPTKLVGKLFTSIDRSIHRVMGAPSPLPPMPQSGANGKESHVVSSKVVNSQSTMAMASLMPSDSADGVSEPMSDAGRKSMHGRSVSEPDFGRSPKKDASSDANSRDAQNKTPSLRFTRIGSQLLQKTMSWVSRSRPDRQAKLGESNKFYYDEKLKRWVEEGAELPGEDAALPPPPNAASFQNGTAEYSINDALKNHSLTATGISETRSTIPSNNSGIPPLSPSPNQFSARGIGVRSRYVDTFNKGGNSPASSFRSPSAPVIKPPSGAKFFIPTSPALSSPNEQMTDTPYKENGDLCTSLGAETSFNSSTPPPPLPPPSTIEGFRGSNNAESYNNNGMVAALPNGNGLFFRPSVALGSDGYNASTAAFTETSLAPPSSLFSSNSETLYTSNPAGLFIGGTPVDDLDVVDL